MGDAFLLIQFDFVNSRPQLREKFFLLRCEVQIASVFFENPPLFFKALHDEFSGGQFQLEVLSHYFQPLALKHNSIDEWYSSLD